MANPLAQTSRPGHTPQGPETRHGTPTAPQGRTHPRRAPRDDVPVTGPRIISLVPSATETLIAWGRTPIACTRFCEQPTITHVGGTKNPDLAAIVALAPDLVVVDREENRREDHDALVEAGLDVHVLAIRSV